VYFSRLLGEFREVSSSASSGQEKSPEALKYIGIAAKHCAQVNKLCRSARPRMHLLLNKKAGARKPRLSSWCVPG